MSVVVESLRDVVELYRVARELKIEPFAAHGFAWVRARLQFDVGVVVTTLTSDPSFIDAQFCDVADQRAFMEGYSRVRHLDDTARKMIATPFRAFRHDLDAPELAGTQLAPLREHLARCGGHSMLGIAVPTNDRATLSVLTLGRASLARRFSDEEKSYFEAIALHFIEACVVNRTICLGAEAGERVETLPVALLDRDGRLLQTTSAFVRKVWPDAAPQSSFLPDPILRAIRKGKPWPLPDKKHSLHGHRIDDGYFLRVRSNSVVDGLSAREREIAILYSRGASYKSIASDLALAPATVRNHLQNIYNKLGVGRRDELSELLRRP